MQFPAIGKAIGCAACILPAVDPQKIGHPVAKKIGVYARRTLFLSRNAQALRYLDLLFTALLYLSERNNAAQFSVFRNTQSEGYLCVAPPRLCDFSARRKRLVLLRQCLQDH